LKIKKSYLLLIILTLGILYFILRIFFGFFTPYNYFSAQKDIKNGPIQIISVGEPYMPQNEQILAAKYGFKYKYVGCNVTNDLINGSNYYNAVVKEYLTDKFGKDFWNRFNSQLDSIQNLNNIILPKEDLPNCSFDKILSDSKTPKLAKELFNNTAKNSDEALAYFKYISSNDKQKRYFYFRVLTNSYKIADGSYSEGLGNFGKEFIENNPKEFCDFFDKKECFTENDLEIWAKIVVLEFQIIDENIETGKGEPLVESYSKKLIKDSEWFPESQKKTIRKFTNYLKNEWGDFLKNI
jgi:hypothetical protein